MYLAVRFWKTSSSKPSDAPDFWPREVKELGMSQVLPGPNWVLMTCQDFVRYKAERQPLYDAWKAKNVEPSELIDPDAPEEP